ncbi:PAS domain S-box protein [Dongia sp.]|uniref:PAS domain S-box protein n=1 Tax=Dongia sp. TaxID=1977262 RepID=UPI0035B22F42
MQISEDIRLSIDQIGEVLSMRPELVTDRVAIIAITDLDGTITYANDLFVEISGYSREELVGANHRILNSGLHPERFFEEMFRTISDGRIWRGEIRNRAKNGRYYWVDTHIIPTFDQSGALSGYTAVRFDITKRKQAEEAFRDISQLQTAILDHAGYAIIGTRTDGTIEIFNRAAEKMLGYSAVELIGRATPALMHEPSEIAAHAKRLSAALKRPVEPGFDAFVAEAIAGQRSEHEWTYVRKDGSRFPVLLSVTALRNEEGELTGFLGMAVDISERREREAALTRTQCELQNRLTDLELANERIEMEAARQVTLLEDLAIARDEAQAAVTEKSRFLATMSHEIRTPMNGVVGVLGLLKSSDLTTEQANLVGTALRSANELIQITTDILDLSKLEANKTELELADFDIRELMTDVVGLLRPSALAKGVDLHCALAPQLPRFLKGDAHRIRQIVVNLISNAIKFTLHGSVSLQVDCSCLGDAGVCLLVWVKDTGIGIDQESTKRLFNRFAQAEQSTTRRYGGTGLGLAICKQLTELMSGEIGVESQFGVGSTFWFKIPMQVGRAPDLKTLGGQTLEERSLRLLVAEDNTTNQFLMRAILESLGHQVTIVDNGVEAVRIAGIQDFDAILMDVQMPVMDGPTATREIRHLNSRAARLPIVALTANAMPGDRERYIAAGMDDYVSKPVDPHKLMDVLAGLILRPESA